MAMFGRNDEHAEQSTSATIIGASVKVEGKFKGKGNIIVEGKVQGSMKTNHDIQVKEGAQVRADLEAQNVVIAGEVHGNIKAIDRVEIFETAKVFGNVEAKVLSIGAGATLNGKCIMVTEGAMAEEATEQTVVDQQAEERGRNARNGKNGKALKV